MDRKKIGLSVKSLKRQAKKIKKELGITYLKALDQAAVNAGFTGYKNYLNRNPLQVKPKRQRAIKRPAMPSPRVKAFYPSLSTIRNLRPNAKMPVTAHQELGGLLKELKEATYDHKRANQPLRDVANLLDEWVQKEYNRAELSDDVFSLLYYGDVDIEPEESPSASRKSELTQMCIRAKAIITKNYHDCGPVRELLRKIDLSIKWMPTWPAVKPVRQFGRKTALIPGGTFIHVKSSRKPGILIRHDPRSQVVVCYTDKGPMTAARFQITVPKDQSALKTFKPMRLYLPYGKWTLKDGTQVLYNRDYCPLWAKKPDGKVIPVDPDAWVERTENDESFFHDGSAPWNGNKETAAGCIAALKEWGVEKRISGPLALLPEAIATGDTGVLRPKHTNKYFPSKTA